MIPFTNATLTAIAGGSGTSPDYDAPAAPGANRWAGTLGVYVAEEVKEILSPDRIDEIKQTRVELPYAVGKLVQRGDTLTYTYEGAAQQRVAGTITHSPLVGRVQVLVERA